jgi:integrase
MVTMVEQRTGHCLTPHQYRHFVAKISLDAEPGNYFGVATLLGHKSLKTTMAFYSGLRTKAAGKHFAAILDRDRQAVLEKAGVRRRRAKR